MCGIPGLVQSGKGRVVNNILVWVWALAALVFFVAEIFTAGFFLVCFGLGAVVAALLAGLGFDLIWQALAFLGVSVLALVFLRPFAVRVSGETRNPGGIDRVAGKTAVVLEEIDPLLGTGMVRIDREEWRADSVDHIKIAKDALVEVVGVSGTRVLVKPRAPSVSQ